MAAYWFEFIDNCSWKELATFLRFIFQTPSLNDVFYLWDDFGECLVFDFVYLKFFFIFNEHWYAVGVILVAYAPDTYAYVLGGASH